MLSALGLSHSIFGERLLPDRHALRSLHRARPRCAELCLLPGCALHAGGDAVGRDAGAGGRRASVDRHAADRHGAGRARRLRAGLRRRARGDHALGASTTCSATATASPIERTWLRDETGGSVYLRLSTRPIEQPQRAMTPELAQRHRRRRLLAAQARPECRGRRRLYRRRRAGSDRGGRADGGGPPRRRPAGRHLGRPAECRLDGGAARARARPRPCARAMSSGCSATLPPHCGLVTVHRRPSRRRSAWLGSRRTAIARARSASSISARPARSPTSTAITASTRMPSSLPRRRRAGPADAPPRALP